MSRTFEEIARVAHETNRAYCAVLGDTTQRPWAVAPAWQRESVMVGVAAVEANPQTTARESHEGWLAHKRQQGWKYGPRKDEARKEHPCFVPYDELPEDQRKKDELFIAVVKTLLGVDK